MATKYFRSSVNRGWILKLLRVYFTTFNDEEYDEIKRELEKLCDRIVEHESTIKEFKYLELYGPTANPEYVANLIKRVLGEECYVRVDEIEIIVPKNSRIVGHNI